ncbi:ABC transporter ATP-binding protein [Thermomicrobium sp. 4228-Ro]|uniref:ABC transporter ATP-binding protein n=1 Tax=Thermomicrobium sp. 4228-Ro TaxID=2993937 RepID=UPI00224928BC|nr:ABC transporter ATP-binding protein [Thermomicrobium sp. 4228-Ro]MCX2727989.1 ABC transporter ATP-binding protein [Thermomicrobium sp. 4228-Ro]
MADASLLEIRDLHAYYGQSHILQGIDLTLRHEPLALLGRNGMGKTTLCLALTGLLPSVRGSIRFAGQELVGKPPHRIAALGIGYVPQGRRIFPSLTVEEHLRLLPRRRGLSGDDVWTIERVYDLFPRLAERRRQVAGTLSGGEQQMLAIARALLTNPRLLVMDEPSEGLAPVIVDQLVATLRQLAASGLSILLVEQRLAVATAIASRIAIMLAGRIVLETSAEALLADPALQQQYLGVSARRAA